MSTYVIDTRNDASAIKTLLGEIEMLRKKRREEWRNRQHPEQKRFTQEEICDGPCPTYRNLLIGRSKRLPSRNTVMAIADYLECNIDERNDLLVAAQYLPEKILLTDEEYAKMIAQAKLMLALLPLPAVVFGRGTEVIDANEIVLKQNGLPPLETWHPSQRDMLHWFFDPALPSYALYRPNETVWQINAQLNMEFLRTISRNYQYEDYFLRKVEQWCLLSDFDHYWQATMAQHASALPLAHVPSDMYMQTPLLEQPIREQNIFVPISETMEVFLIFGVPKDEAAYCVYEMLGCDLQNVRWELLVSDLQSKGG